MKRAQKSIGYSLALLTCLAGFAGCGGDKSEPSGGLGAATLPIQSPGYCPNPIVLEDPTLRPIADEREFTDGRQGVLLLKTMRTYVASDNGSSFYATSEVLRGPHINGPAHTLNLGCNGVKDGVRLSSRFNTPDAIDRENGNFSSRRTLSVSVDSKGIARSSYRQQSARGFMSAVHAISKKEILLRDGTRISTRIYHLGPNQIDLRVQRTVQQGERLLTIFTSSIYERI